MAPLSDPVTDKARKTGKAETWGRFYETVSPEKIKMDKFKFIPIFWISWHFCATKI
jgi:hypothetical protein